MEDDEELPVFAFVEKDGCMGREILGMGTSFENSPETGVIYLTINDNTTENEGEEEEPTSYLVQHDAGFDDSTALNSEINIITVGGEQYFYIPSNDDESVQSIEPILITNEESIVKPETVDIVEESQSNVQLGQELHISDSEEAVIKVLRPYEMIMMNNIGENEPTLETTKKFRCLYKGCEKLYSTSQQLTVHMRIHTNGKPFPCPYEGCDKKFATNYSLTTHCRTHTGEKPYTCQVCGKCFKTSGDLMKHVRTHTGEKPFGCPFEGCGKSFATSNIRKVHVRSHTGERPYVCDYPNCGKAFASGTNYKNHARIHSGEKPYVCSVEGCDKKFTEYSSLYKHQAVHQVDSPHECNYCKLKFKSEHTLNVHRKMKHGVLVTPQGTIEELDLEHSQGAYYHKHKNFG